jgi:formylglycine-generating enzyme required for sulfatase activity
MTAPVGSFPANSFGLHDMSGNVWEWTCSAWQDDFDGEEQQCTDLKSTEARVLRGGPWGDSSLDARSAPRLSPYPDLRDSSIGFRVLCSSPIDE